MSGLTAWGLVLCYLEHSPPEPVSGQGPSRKYRGLLLQKSKILCIRFMPERAAGPFGSAVWAQSPAHRPDLGELAGAWRIDMLPGSQTTSTCPSDNRDPRQMHKKTVLVSRRHPSPPPGLR